MNNKRSIIYGFNLIKIIAITLIVFHHYYTVFNMRATILTICGKPVLFGYLVEIFFMISGFLSVYTSPLSLKLKKNQELTKGSNDSDNNIILCNTDQNIDITTMKAGELIKLQFRRFIYKISRYYPMATIACLFVIAVKCIGSNDLINLQDTKAHLANLFLIFEGWPCCQMIGYNNPTWYLCILTKCLLWFLTFELIVKYILAKKKTGTHIKIQDTAIRLLSIGIVIISIRILRSKNVISFTAYRGLNSFFTGVGIYVICNNIRTNKYFALLYAVLSICLYYYALNSNKDFLVYVVYPALLLLCVNWNGLKHNKLKRVLELLGDVSFEVLVWHYPFMALEQAIIRITGREINRSNYTMIGFTILTWIICWFIYVYIERPINNILRKRRETIL